jgi:hypothetical protein
MARVAFVLMQQQRNDVSSKEKLRWDKKNGDRKGRRLAPRYAGLD